MKETMIMDGHEYFKREDGIWETKDDFYMDLSDWTMSGDHGGMMCVFYSEG